MSNYPDNFNSARADRYNGDDAPMTENEKFIESLKGWVKHSMLYANGVLKLEGEELDNFYNDLILTITESALEKRYAAAIEEVGHDYFFSCRMVRPRSLNEIHASGIAKLYGGVK